MHRLLALVFGGSLVFVLGCGQRGQGTLASQNPVVPVTTPSTQAAPVEEQQTWTGDAKEEWIDKPIAEWPQLLVTSKASFRGRDGLDGARAFLVKEKSGRVLVATSRQLLDGLKPRVPIEKLEGVLDSWTVFQPGSKKATLSVARPARAGYDMVLLELKSAPTDLPAQPLRIREKPVDTAEPVFLIGWSDADGGQTVYKGIVRSRHNGPIFEFSVAPAVDLEDLIGAPIIDAKGYAVGMLSTFGYSRGKDNRDHIGGAEELRGIYTAGDPKAGMFLVHRAAEELKRRMAAEDLADSGVVRIFIKDDDRDQAFWRIDPDGTVTDDDWKTRVYGVTIVVDSSTLADLRGTIVDYLPSEKMFFIVMPHPYPRR